MPRDDAWEADLTSLLDDEEKSVDVGIGIAHGRRSFTYYRLPEPLLRLFIYKLDGSSFDVQIARTAHVRELKRAVENVFVRPPNHGAIHISWSHVWSHFCLTYKGEKLIDDGASLRSLRIRDGDQLSFVRFLSINSSPMRQQHRHHGIDLERKHRRTMTAPEVLMKIEESSMNKNSRRVDPRQYAEQKFYNYEENESLNGGHKESRLSHFLFRWFSCGLQRSSRTRSEVRTHPSRTSGNDYRVVKY